jgi:hypothetical protein
MRTWKVNNSSAKIRINTAPMMRVNRFRFMGEGMEWWRGGAME